MGARAGLVLGMLLAALALGTPSAAAADADLELTATVDGRSLAEAGANKPLVLRPTDTSEIAIAVTNNGSSDVEIRSVRLNARVLGLAFFSYTTRVDLTVEPGETGKRTFVLDLGDLDGQATGLLPAELALLGPDRTVLASDTGTVDVKGKLTSVYGVFGLAVAAITALLLGALVVRLFRRTLPDSRWSRALRFAVPGLGLGLVAAFTLGALGIAVPSTGTCLGLLVGGLVVGFVLGYLTPAPGDEADRDELDERDVVTSTGTGTGTGTDIFTPSESRVTAPAFAPQPAEPDDPRQTRVVGPPPPPGP